MPCPCFPCRCAADGPVDWWAWERPPDLIDFCRLGSREDRVRLERAQGSVNLHRFHGWRAGTLTIEWTCAEPTDRTHRRQPVYLLVTRIRIACLAGMADAEWRESEHGCRLEIVRCRTDFNTLPLGQMIAS